MNKSEDDRSCLGQMEAYLTGQGSDAEREHWERLLLEDAEALSLYIEALEEYGDELPSLENSSLFVHKVMENWADQEMPDYEAGQRRIHWYEKTLFHYTVAAMLTLLILSSGMFDKLLTGNMDVVVQGTDQSPSYSEQMMKATSGWLDQLMGGRHN